MNTLQEMLLNDLRSALRMATKVGLFDTPEVQAEMHPDVINNFCDGLDEVAKDMGSNQQ